MVGANDLYILFGALSSAGRRLVAIKTTSPPHRMLRSMQLIQESDLKRPERDELGVMRCAVDLCRDSEQLSFCRFKRHAFTNREEVKTFAGNPHLASRRLPGLAIRMPDDYLAFAG